MGNIGIAGATPQVSASQSLYFIGTIPFAPSNVSTSFGVPLSFGGTPMSIFNADTLELIIANNNTSFPVTNAWVTFSETLGGQVVTVTYSFSAVSFASNSYQKFRQSLSFGILANVSFFGTFSSAPKSGSLDWVEVLSV